MMLYFCQLRGRAATCRMDRCRNSRSTMRHNWGMGLIKDSLLAKLPGRWKDGIGRVAVEDPARASDGAERKRFKLLTVTSRSNCSLSPRIESSSKSAHPYPFETPSFGRPATVRCSAAKPLEGLPTTQRAESFYQGS